MELQRKKLGLNTETTFYAFKGHLDAATKLKLEMVRINKRASGHMTSFGAKFGWEDVVMICRDEASGMPLADVA